MPLSALMSQAGKSMCVQRCSGNRNPINRDLHIGRPDNGSGWFLNLKSKCENADVRLQERQYASWVTKKKFRKRQKWSQICCASRRKTPLKQEKVGGPFLARLMLARAASCRVENEGDHPQRNTHRAGSSVPCQTRCVKATKGDWASDTHRNCLDPLRAQRLSSTCMLMHRDFTSKNKNKFISCRHEMGTRDSEQDFAMRRARCPYAVRPGAKNVETEERRKKEQIGAFCG